MKCLLNSFIILLFAQCNPVGNEKSFATDSTVVPSQTSADTNSVAQTTCYRKITGRDTLLLKLTRNADVVSGIMVFDNYEKDSSYGLVTGTYSKGLMIVWYNFYAEGMQSVVQHAFKAVGDDLVLGTGATTFRNDSAYLKDTSAVNFHPENLLQHTDCQLVNPQFANFAD